MANRIKRQAEEKARLETQFLHLRLLRQGKVRHAQLRIDREEERQYNRRFIRFIRRGIPDWVLKQDYFETLELFFSYRQYWTQPLAPWPFAKDTKAEKLTSQIARHLFARYELPAFMDNAWERGRPRELSWYIHVGKGGSIRNAPHMHLALTKRMGHFFMQAPDNLDLTQAIRYGQVRGFGGSEKLAVALSHSRLGRYVPKAWEAFWAAAIQWLVNHEPMEPNLATLLVDYMSYLKFERTRVMVPDGEYRFSPPPQRSFQIKGRKFAKLVDSALAWEQAKKADSNTLGSPLLNQIGDFEEVKRLREGVEVSYRILPLITLGELIREGQAMSHCVGTYGNLVKNGHTSIWSMLEIRQDYPPKRLLTIEVSHNRTIIQARGKFNRSPNAKEGTLLKRWARQERLSGYPS